MRFLAVFVQVLMPILVVAGLGYLLARLRVIEDSRSLSRVSIYVLLPALTFSAMAKADLRAGEFVSLVGSAWAIAALQAAIGLFLARRFAFDNAQEGAFLLSIITANAGNFGIPFNSFAFGPETVGPASVYYIASLLVTYVGGILVTTPSVAGIAGAAGKVLRMPILYAAAAGFLVNRFGLTVPEPLLRPIQLTGGAAVPIMLTLLGVELARARVRQDRVTLSCVFGLRLIAAPAMAAALALALGLHGVVRDVVIVQSAMPTAVGAALMAVELNARPALVSSAVLVTTLGSLITLTLLLGLLGQS